MHASLVGPCVADGVVVPCALVVVDVVEWAVSVAVGDVVVIGVPVTVGSFVGEPWVVVVAVGVGGTTGTWSWFNDDGSPKGPVNNAPWTGGLLYPGIDESWVSPCASSNCAKMTVANRIKGRRLVWYSISNMRKKRLLKCCAPESSTSFISQKGGYLSYWCHKAK